MRKALDEQVLGWKQGFSFKHPELERPADIWDEEPSSISKSRVEGELRASKVHFGVLCGRVAFPPQTSQSSQAEGRWERDILGVEDEPTEEIGKAQPSRGGEKPGQRVWKPREEIFLRRKKWSD